MQINANAVVCESIHQESNGKFILVGVINGVLMTEDSSIDHEYCLFVNFYYIPEGEHSIQLKFSTPDNKSSHNTFDVVVPNELIGATVQIRQIPFKTERSGIFRMQWRLSTSKKWLSLIDVPVELSAVMDDSRL